MTSTSTHNLTFTRAHTATYLTEVILGTISDILAHLGINASQLTRDWNTNEAAINAWIAEGSLEQVVLECHHPAGTVAPVMEFPVTFTTSGTADAEFTASRARLARFLAKLDTVPAGTTYRLFCTFTGPHTPQPGWGPASRAGTDGLRSTTFGSLGRAPHGSAGMRYLYR